MVKSVFTCCWRETSKLRHVLFKSNSAQLKRTDLQIYTLLHTTWNTDTLIIICVLQLLINRMLFFYNFCLREPIEAHRYSLTAKRSFCALYNVECNEHWFGSPVAWLDDSGITLRRIFIPIKNISAVYVLTTIPQWPKMQLWPEFSESLRKIMCPFI